MDTVRKDTLYMDDEVISPIPSERQEDKLLKLKQQQLADFKRLQELKEIQEREQREMIEKLQMKKDFDAA